MRDGGVDCWDPIGRALIRLFPATSYLGADMPAFPLIANIFTYGSTMATPPRVIVACALHPVVKGNITVLAGGATSNAHLYSHSVGVWFPAGTDVRDSFSGPIILHYDTIEVPAGSGRYYEVYYADDANKEQVNEFRFVQARKSLALDGVTAWPTPMP